MYKIGITFGSFNPIHFGHILLFQKIKYNCEYLVVGVDDDDYVKFKGKELFQNYDIRANIVYELKSVDLVVPQTKIKNKNYWVKKLGCDVIFVGDDHKNTSWDGETVANYNNICVEYLPHTKYIHSSNLREIIKGEHNE